MDRNDLRVLLGLLAVSVGVLWVAFILGLAIQIIRLLGGV